MNSNTNRKSKNLLLKSSLGVAGATFISRILGLARVWFESRILGGQEIASAWGLAFAIPNTFRRILGEGALGQALTPLIAESETRGDKTATARELGLVFTMLGILLTAIIILVSLTSIGLKALFTSNYFTTCFPALSSARAIMTLTLLPLLMPYTFFICMVGAANAMLGLRRIFFIPALAPIILNLMLIGGLAAAYGKPVELSLLEHLSILVLISGITQFIITVFLLKRCNFFPDFSLSIFKYRYILKDLRRLIFYGLIGGATLQVSFLIDRFCAISLGARAVPALNYVDRIIDVPIGIFAISMGQVLIASMAGNASRGDTNQMTSDLQFSLRQVYFICIPAAVTVIFFWKQMLEALCLGGNYTTADLEAAKYVAIFYGVGIPAFCANKILATPLYARKMMKTTMKCSLIALAVNIVCNLTLMWPMRQGGIALATVISNLVNNLMLIKFLQKENIRPWNRSTAECFIKALLFSLGAGCIMLRLIPYLKPYLNFKWLGNFPILLVLLTGFGLLYMLCHAVARSKELKEMFYALKYRKFE